MGRKPKTIDTFERENNLPVGSLRKKDGRKMRKDKYVKTLKNENKSLKKRNKK